MSMIANEHRGLRYEGLKPSQQVYIDWLAGGQTVIDEDGKLEQLTSVALSERVGVTRQALWKYRQLPGFWDMVAKRRTELYGQDRMSMLYKALLAKGLKGDSAAIKLMLQQARMLEAERTQLEVSGTVAVAVINYSSDESIHKRDVIENPSINTSSIPREKSISGTEKAQKEKVPVPEYITSPTQPAQSDTANGALSPQQKTAQTRRHNRELAQVEAAKVAHRKEVRRIQNARRTVPAKQNTGKAVTLEPGKNPIHFKDK